MDMMVIVWVGLGVLVFALSYILPKRKEELDEDTKKFAGEQIRDILNKEIAGMQSKLDDVVTETIEESSSQTERALEKLTNEKMMAINEYSDTVIEDINVNHKEVLFLYDMLNDKHVTIRNTVTEVENTMGEITQTAKDIEISAKEAAKRAKDSEEIAERAVGITNLAEKAAQRTAQSMEMDVRHIVEDMIRGRVEETMEKTALPMIQERVDAILEDATLLMEQKPKILVENEKNADSEKESSESSQIKEEVIEEKEDTIEENTEEKETMQEESAGEEPEVEFVQGITQNAPQVVIDGEDENNLSYHVVEPEIKESAEMVPETSEQSETEMSSETVAAADEVRDSEKKTALEIMQEARKAAEAEESEPETQEAAEPKESEPETQKAAEPEESVPDESRQEENKPEINGIQKQSEPENIQAKSSGDFTEPEMVSSWTQEDIFGREDQNRSGRNNNEKILALHKAGMSELAIAKELRLGVGEVKLVIDLFKGM